jgi:hypothetical protein
MITWCLLKRCRAKTSFYTGRLGLRQLEHKQGPPRFYGHAAQSWKALHQSTLEAQKLLRSRFKTKDDLRAAALDQGHTLITEVTEPLLAEHGAIIWNISAPYSTILNNSAYPEYLRYSEDNDRERLAMRRIIT